MNPPSRQDLENMLFGLIIACPMHLDRQVCPLWEHPKVKATGVTKAYQIVALMSESELQATLANHMNCPYLEKSLHHYGAAFNRFVQGSGKKGLSWKG